MKPKDEMIPTLESLWQEGLSAIQDDKSRKPNYDPARIYRVGGVMVGISLRELRDETDRSSSMIIDLFSISNTGNPKLGSGITLRRDSGGKLADVLAFRPDHFGGDRKMIPGYKIPYMAKTLGMWLIDAEARQTSRELVRGIEDL